MTSGDDRTDGMDTGTYEVLRDRLAAQAAELTRRARALDEARIAEFGSTELTLTGGGAVRTAEARVPGDLVSVAGHLLFGFRPASPVGELPTVTDVFALYDRELAPLPEDAVPGLLDDPDFRREFDALHRYFRGACLLRLRQVDGKLLAVFRTGERAEDIRVLRWALDADRARFLDARGERDHVFPPPDDIVWRQTTRDDHRLGRHPHIRVADGIYVSTVGGSLTVKSEDDTETAEGTYTEPVTEPLQSLADAEIAHARAGALVLLRVRPYKEDADRCLVVNSLTGAVVRLDGIGQSCRRLPADQGVVFPGGYCLATGAVKSFALDASGMEFEQVLRSPNGEDVLFVYHTPGERRRLLLPYNLIREEVASPLVCHGYALFADGGLLALRAETGEPGQVHPLQIWQTPYTADTHAVTGGEGPLSRIGNADLVRGISDCLSLARQATETTPTGAVYQALAAACTRAEDAHHWLGAPEAHDLRTPLRALRATAVQVVDEFETVQELGRRAAEALAAAGAELAGLVRRIRGEAPATALEWVARISELRAAQGRLGTLREMRHADTEAVDALDEQARAGLADAGRRAVAFLRRDEAFHGFHEEIGRLEAEGEALTTVASVGPVGDRLAGQQHGLRTLGDVVTGLDIEDATARTAVLERIAEATAAVNRARATLAARRRALLDREGRAEFAAELALLAQSVTAALDAAGTPADCDDQLARLTVQLENLRSRFAEHEEFLTEIADQHTRVHEALTARRQSLTEEQARRAERLAGAAGRTLQALARRAATLPDPDAVHTHFASDPMVLRVRAAADDLRALGEQVRAEELLGRLKAAQQEATRALRDRADLYVDGGEVIRLGRHRFAVNRQEPELTLVPHQDGLALALTGTDHRSPVTDPAFAATRRYWGRHLVSESPEVYRAEYLAARLLAEHGATALAGADLPALVRSAADAAYDEGYERGVHDHDALAVLNAVVRLWHSAGPLRYPPHERAAAQLFWAHTATAQARTAWTRRARSLARARETFGPVPAIDDLKAELASAVGSLPAARYLFEELTGGPEGFALSAPARTLLDKFRRTAGTPAYDDDLAALPDLKARRQLVEGWLGSYAAARGTRTDDGELAEAVAAELCPALARYDAEGEREATLTGLRGDHPRIDRGRLSLRIDEFLARTEEFTTLEVPGFRDYQRQRTALLATARDRLDIDAHRPRVMASFVRGRLVDEVLLPLIGDNLAKQIGAAGAAGHTDSSGLLLLVSPPGYGKTTLMEYVAARLGMLLVKVEGPALGHGVTSLDPAQAPHAAARRQLEKVAFALDAGNNVLLYLDDIQHVSPELLQQFIPLCDATRTLEGRDLRGKRFAVCMAGNPYTESGGRFQVPDMLANRADVWNLGEVMTGKEDAFAASFVENALTSNPDLAPLAGSAFEDLDLLLRLAQNDPTAHRDRLRHPLAPAELDRVLSVLRHLLTARETVLTVNAAYIASAARAESTRTEPPFRLQGSYRNMNKIAARISPAMNDAELHAVIDDHYAAEARTLTAGAEANLLKLAELRGTLTPEQAPRWAEVKATYTTRGGQRVRALNAPQNPGS